MSLRVISGQTVATQNPTLSALVQKRTNYCYAAIVRFVPKATDALQQTASLFDHLVGTREQCRRYGKTKHLRGLEVDRQFVLCQRLHRQRGRFLALEDAVDIALRALALVEESRPIRNQATASDVIAGIVDSG